MLKKLEVDALKADLAAVTSLLAARTEDDDPVGWLQLSSRKADIENELTQLEAVPENRLIIQAVAMPQHPLNLTNPHRQPRQSTQVDEFGDVGGGGPSMK